MVIKQFIDAAYAWVLANGRSLDRKVLAILDELPNIAPINNLGGIASTVASQGMQLVSVVQDLSQLHTRYGSNDANTIINNHRALLLLTGVKDTVTLDLASKLLGNIEQTPNLDQPRRQRMGTPHPHRLGTRDAARTSRPAAPTA